MMTKSAFFLLIILFSHTTNVFATPVRAEAIFAGGCFWCMETDFEQLPGIVEVKPGYTGGHVVNPSYDQVSSGTTGHVEAIKVVYDPSQTSFESLVNYYWLQIDPTNNKGQFRDQGNQYRSMLFFQNEQEKKILENSVLQLEKTKPFPDPIMTEIKPASRFFPAENEHQNYHRKHPLLYKLYRFSCGRDRRLKELWGK